MFNRYTQHNRGMRIITLTMEVEFRKWKSSCGFVLLSFGMYAFIRLLPYVAGSSPVWNQIETLVDRVMRL